MLKLPQALTYSFERNLAPKLDYLTTEVGLPPVELRRRVVAQPALLGYSLERRYKERIARCLAAGLPASHALDRMSLGDVRFDQTLEGKRVAATQQQQT